MADYNCGFKDLLNKAFIVERKSYVKDNIGGKEKTWIRVGAYKGRLSTTSKNDDENLVAGQFIAVVDYVLFCLANVDIEREDRIKVDNNYFNVISKINPSAIDHHLEVYLEQIQPVIDFSDIEVIIAENTKLNANLIIVSFNIETIINIDSALTTTIEVLRKLITIIIQNTTLITNSKIARDLETLLLENINLLSQLSVIKPISSIIIENTTLLATIRTALNIIIEVLSSITANLVTDRILSSNINVLENIIVNLKASVPINTIITENLFTQAILNRLFSLNTNITETININTLLSVEKELNSSILENSLLTANMENQFRLVTNITENINVTANLVIDGVINLNSTLIESINILSTLDIDYSLNSNININFNIESILKINRELQVNILEVSNLIGNLSILGDKNLESLVIVNSSLESSLNRLRELESSIISTSTLTGLLDIQVSLITEILTTTNIISNLLISIIINNIIIENTSLDSQISLNRNINSNILEDITITTNLNVKDNFLSTITLESSNLTGNLKEIPKSPVYLSTKRYVLDLNPANGVGTIIISDNSSNTPIDPTTALTVEVLAYIKTNENVIRHIISFKNVAYYIRILPDSQTFDVYWYGTSLPGYHNSTIPIPEKEWVHLAVVWDGTQLKFYVNGKLDPRIVNTSTPANQSNYDLYIGEQRQGANLVFRGFMSEYRLWKNVERTQEQIREFMHKEVSNASGLGVYYKLNQNSGTTVTDSSSNSLNGVLDGNLEWVKSDLPIVENIENTKLSGSLTLT